MTRPVEVFEPEQHKKDFRIICEGCKRDFGGTVGAEPGCAIHYIQCPSCKYGSFENFLAQQPEPPLIVADPEPPPVQVLHADQQPKYVLCDIYANGCGKGFTISSDKYMSGTSHICGSCNYKRLTLQLLHEEQRIAARLGHSQSGDKCELCAIQNQIDSHTDYDWRTIYERLQETVMRSYDQDLTR